MGSQKVGPASGAWVFLGHIYGFTDRAIVGAGPTLEIPKNKDRPVRFCAAIFVAGDRPQGQFLLWDDLRGGAAGSGVKGKLPCGVIRALQKLWIIRSVVFLNF